MRNPFLRPLAAPLLLAAALVPAPAQSVAQQPAPHQPASHQSAPQSSAPPQSVHRDDQRGLPTARPFSSGHREKPADAAAPAPATDSGSGGADFIDNKTASSQNLAAAEQEDEEYVFKHSASVRAVARWFHLSPDDASMLFWGLNAALLFVFVGYFLVTGLPKAFRSRREVLERQMVQARSMTEQADERLRVVEQRLGRLDSEIAGIRAQAEQDSARDGERIRLSMEEEKKKIVASAEQEIAAAGVTAERKLRSFAAELAVDRATARLRLTEDDDRALIREFAAELGADGSRGGRN